MKTELKTLTLGIVALLVVVGLLLFILPHYSIWRNHMAGQATLARAEYEKKVAVETAKAKLEAADFEAQSEIRRAEGLAKAISIVGEQAKKYPEYRHQHFIDGFAEALKEGKVQSVIYVPTEANIPILERRSHDRRGD